MPGAVLGLHKMGELGLRSVGYNAITQESFGDRGSRFHWC